MISRVLLMLPVVTLSLLPDSIPRRQLLEDSVLIGVTLLGGPSPSLAVKGAAELDLEFYLRDLVGGNTREGTIQASAPPPLSPPRTLTGELLPILLDNQCSTNCAPCQALTQQIAHGTGQDPKSIALDIERRIQDLRERSSRSFRTRAPWKDENVADQYYFDFTSYALWRTAGDLLPNYLDRDNFVRTTGRLIYKRLVSEGLVRPVNPGTERILADVFPATLELLELFKSSGFCKDYRIRGDDSREVTDAVFDEIDDESLLAGSTVDCLVSIFEPATLGASLQITGEQSRFGPDFVGCTLAALWETVGVGSKWEIFFVDPEYRPNPKDYFPNEQLYQFTLTKITR